MEYEIVQLEDKVLFSTEPVHLSSLDPEMSDKIEFVWHSFLCKSDEVKNKVTNKPICVYSSYESDNKGKYDVSIGYEVEKDARLANGWIRKIIPSGRYARFLVVGNMQREVSNFWRNIDKLGLPRKFGCDFEECQNMDMINAEVHIYVSLV